MSLLAVEGAAKSLLARRARLRRDHPALAYGLFGFAFLPLLLCSTGETIADMPKMVGWTTYTMEHVMCRLLPGVGWASFTRQDRPGVSDRT